MKSSRNVMTFSRGIHPHGDGKSLSCHTPVQNVPLLEKYTVILAQNAGKPPRPVVKKGDTVKKYQLIAQADGFVFHQDNSLQFLHQISIFFLQGHFSKW